MAIQLLFFAGQEAPPNQQLDGAIVVVWEVAYQVVVTIPARQVAIVENHAYAVVVDDPAREIAVVTAVDPHLAVVTTVAPPIAKILTPEIPVAKVTENSGGAETVDTFDLLEVR